MHLLIVCPDSDRASAASVLWTSSTKEADLTTSLPMCSTREFHQEVSVMHEELIVFLVLTFVLSVSMVP